MSTTFNFTGKNVFVVGGTSGINFGIASGFARWGANVVVASRKEQKVANAVAELKALGASANGVTLDVRDYEQVEDGFESACKFLGGDIDILISGAAGNFPARVNDMSPNAIRSVLEIDLLGTFHVMRAGFNYLKKPGASVINISAPQAFLPMAHQAHVCAAKAGVDMVTRTLSMEWGQDGVRVNSIVPGPIAGTEGMDRLSPTPDLQAAVAKSVPLKRLGEVHDIAHAAGMLCAEESSYISGIVLPVDGGWSQTGATSVMDKMSRMLDTMKP
ncbi:short-chain dehydrogenase [Oleiphilus sp. HI0009]|uniref:SDR family oxidoreductase n=2 Tax=Oleiphilus TaxID=141450 RepID=UPI0007C3B585|nr:MULTISPECIES: SDR family oxidoreductase [unclassified Oleiphilus]KZX79383.1 short-chain dehydrogenase [Oleiphilus sp. HI0009]KZY63077.1 short-chain dehydrogenase [Oleiphilus sp. HI0066]KZY68655.1 short-chain dehydrogenase [Oleiphilus sp. HI0066]KZY69136.1 short-chain dehydrogenase [Oleiphilus sp. HI0067]